LLITFDLKNCDSSKTAERSGRAACAYDQRKRLPRPSHRPSTLAWNNITVRYKQAYLGVGWAVLKPLTLMPVCTSVRSFVEIPSGNVPYPILAFAALLP